MSEKKKKLYHMHKQALESYGVLIFRSLLCLAQMMKTYRKDTSLSYTFLYLRPFSWLLLERVYGVVYVRSKSHFHLDIPQLLLMSCWAPHVQLCCILSIFLLLASCIWNLGFSRLYLKHACVKWVKCSQQKIYVQLFSLYIILTFSWYVSLI